MSRGGDDPQKQSNYYDHYAKVLGGNGSAGGGGNGGGSKRMAVIAGGVAAAVIVVGGGIWLGNRGGGGPAAAPTVVTSTSASTTTTSSAPPTSTSASSSPTSTGPAAAATVQPGWKVVPGQETDHATFQIPPKWRNDLGTKSVVVWGVQPDLGYSSPNMVGLHSAAFAGVGTCDTDKKEQTAAAGFRPPSDDLPTDAASSAATRVAKAIAMTDKGKAGKKPPAPAVSQVSINDQDATMAKVTAVSGKPGRDCRAKKSDVYAVAFNAGDKTTVWMLVADHAGKSVPSAQLVKKIIGTITPAVS